MRCHDPHDARMPTGSSCTLCHDGGVRYDAPRAHRVPLASRVPRPVAIFRHDTHEEVACTACHGTDGAHATFTVSRIDDCRSCHHNQPLAAECRSCHQERETSGRMEVSRTLDIRIGTIDRPSRSLVFEHAPHARLACQSCHNGGLALDASGTDCSACHSAHHEPATNCRACHAAPAEGSHDRTAHLGCGGAGCHEAAPLSIQAAPRSRDLCLVCHQDRSDHKADRVCAGCHALPPPDPARISGPASR